MPSEAMTSSRPYIIRALHDWILDNQCTPYILVYAYEEGVQVPQEHVKDGQIILNISPVAVQNLRIGTEEVEFDGRFGGVPTKVFFPISAVGGIYAKENGQGMIFERDPDDVPPPASADGSVKDAGSDPSGATGKKGKPKRPALRVVK